MAITGGHTLRAASHNGVKMGEDHGGPLSTVCPLRAASHNVDEEPWAVQCLDLEHAAGAVIGLQHVDGGGHKLTAAAQRLAVRVGGRLGGDAERLGAVLWEGRKGEKRGGR